MNMRGLYRHFKGNLYFVHGEVLNVEGGEGEEVPCVLYEAVRRIEDAPGRMFVRSIRNFTEIVKRPEYEGPRFVRVE